MIALQVVGTVAVLWLTGVGIVSTVELSCDRNPTLVWAAFGAALLLALCAIWRP